jgi:hypothetical protein
VTVVAIVFLVGYAFSFLPGSAFRHRHELNDYDWGGPHIYVAFMREVAALALALWVLL